MISMYAEYSGRTLYVALSSDTIDGAKNGDKLYEMDTGKRYVYNESNDAWDEQPEEGGGTGNQILTWNLNIVNGTTHGTTSQRNIIVLSDYVSDLQCMRRRSIGVSNPSRIIFIPQALRTTPATGITRTVVLIAIHKDLPSPGYSVEGDVTFYGEISGAPELGSNYNSYIFAVYGDNAKITITN